MKFEKSEHLKKDTLEIEFIERVTESQGIIHKVCRMYCNEENDRKDLFQEILIQLWKSYSTFRGEAKFSTWMYRVGLNVAIQHIKKQNRKPKEVALFQSIKETPEANHEDDFNDKMSLLNAAIEKLNRIERAIILLYLDDKGNDEIAEIVGITQNYVRVKMNRIKVKLRKTLNV